MACRPASSDTEGADLSPTRSPVFFTAELSPAAVMAACEEIFTAPETPRSTEVKGDGASGPASDLQSTSYEGEVSRERAGRTGVRDSITTPSMPTTASICKDRMKTGIGMGIEIRTGIGVGIEITTWIGR